MTDTTISKVTTTIVDLPLHRPHRFATHSIDHQSYLLVHVCTDGGFQGVGEGVSPGGPWWGGESIEGQQQIIDNYLAPALVGADALDLHAARSAMDRVAFGNAFAKAAVDMALVDAAARTYDVPAHVLLGGATRDRLPVRWALSGEGTTEVVAEATERLAAGHCGLKFKMGALTPVDDVARVGQIVDKVGAEVDYLADPNCAWDFRTATWALRELEAMGIGLLEQPLARGDLTGLAALTARATTIRILADEAVCQPREALAVTSNHMCDAVAIKHGKAGGLQRAADIATIIVSGGISCYGGTALESSLGTAAAAHLFAALPSLPLGCELVGPLLLTEDLVTEPVTYSNGDLLVPPGPGFGVEVDWDSVGRHSRKRR